jgi:hypothetical protein
MMSKYMVLIASEQRLLMMCPCQIYAVNYMLRYCQAWVRGKTGDVGPMSGVCAGAISALVYVRHGLPGGIRFCPRATPQTISINELS